MVGADSYRISRALQYSGVQNHFIYIFVYKAVTFYGYPFQSYSTNINIMAQVLHYLHFASHYTHVTTHVSLHDTSLGYSQFAHHYYENHIHFLFLALLRCFSSRRSPFCSIYSSKSSLVLPRKVSPFGNLRIKIY